MTIEEFRKIVEDSIGDEPELDGPMPRELWDKMQTREEVAEGMRAVVRETKAGILNGILKRLSDAEKLAKSS